MLFLACGTESDEPPPTGPEPDVATVRVDVSPATASMVVGDTLRLVAQPRDADGNVLNERVVVWASTNASVAGVDTGGLVTARASGSATVTASVEGRTGEASIQVLTPPVSGDLACGSLIEGSISAVAEVDVLTFDGSAGSTILLTLTQTAGGFGNLVRVRATVLSPTGEEFVVFNSNAQRTLTLQASGLYTVRINASNLTTTGSYAIGLTCLQPPSSIELVLEAGSLIRSSVDAPAHVRVYRLDAQSGDRMLLTLTQTGGGFGNLVRAHATLVSPSGAALLAFNANAQRTVTLLESGPWVLYVNASNLFVGGSYSLGLESLAPVGPTDGALSAGSLLSGEISAPAEVDLYTFAGERGQQILLTATQTSGGFGNLVRAQVTVVSPSGDVLVTFNSNAQRTVILPEEGTYLVQVNASNLFNAGGYNLGVESFAPMGPVDGTLAVGGLVSGMIGAPAEVDVYTFQGTAGENALLTLAQTSGFGNLVRARATVLSPSGIELAAFNSTSQRTVHLPESGRYTLYINASNLFTSGGYTLGRQ